MLYPIDEVESFKRNYIYQLRDEVYSLDDKYKIMNLAQILAKEFSHQLFEKYMKHALILDIRTDGEVPDYNRVNQNRSHYMFRVYHNLTNSGNILSHIEVTVNIDVDNNSSERKIYIEKLKIHDPYYWE